MIKIWRSARMNIPQNHHSLAYLPGNYFSFYVVAERISNHYLVPLEFQIYIFRPMRMTDAILPGSPPSATLQAALTILALSSLPLIAAGQTSQHERAHFLFFTDSLSHIFKQDRPSLSSLTPEQSTNHSEESTDHWCLGNHSFIIHLSF